MFCNTQRYDTQRCTYMDNTRSGEEWTFPQTEYGEGAGGVKLGFAMLQIEKVDEAGEKVSLKSELAAPCLRKPEVPQSRVICYSTCRDLTTSIA